MKSYQLKLSGFLGDALRAYDLTLCSFLAKFINDTFFPPKSSGENLLLFFLIFFMAYFAKALGGIFFGFISDTKGRKKGLQISLILMGCSTFLIGFLPSYKSYGICITFMLIILRIIQGIAAGGEYTTAIVFLLEHSSPKNKASLSCWSPLGFNFGTFLASLGGAIFIYLISINKLPNWSWRILFVFSIIGVIIGYIIRRKTQETLEFIKYNAHNYPITIKGFCKEIHNFLIEEPKKTISIIVLAGFGTYFSFATFFSYGQIHMSTINSFSKTVALLVNSTALLCTVCFIPIFGKLSDKYGRKPFLIISSILMGSLSFPYYFILTNGSITQNIIMHIIIAIPSGCFFCIAPITIIEILPVNIRCTTKALLHGLSASIFGGMAPIIALKCSSQINQYIYLPISIFLFSLIAFLISIRMSEPIKQYINISEYSIENIKP